MAPPPIKERPIVLYHPASGRIAVALHLETLNASPTGEDVRTKDDGQRDGCHLVLIRVFGHPGEVLDEVAESVVVGSGEHLQAVLQFVQGLGSRLARIALLELSKAWYKVLWDYTAW